ncbi:DUF3810 domain-containing protein [Mucilaginibacter sp. OK283]|uniref:DUF3810 domain-containing protein n=1 Tax=Mucilaginibacter sp. OK283 TaxID=1881049 RepID=UPI0008C612BD|nr:DUF3810 domain-containing protein [Mucilaginibacter sp. OK283]SEP03043.1 Protein of unknown function [Mucilaginibacter sp. OK283]
MRNYISKNPFIKRIITILLLAMVLFLLMLLAGHPALVERYYSQGFYKIVCWIFHPVFNLFPFSVGDLLYIAVIVILIVAIVRMVKLLVKKQFKKVGLQLLGWVISIQVAIGCFYLFWGLNYFRPSAADRLNLRDTTFTTTDLKAVTKLLIDSANACRARVTAADLAQSNSAIYQTAVNAVKALSADSVNFRAFQPGIKPSMITFLLNYIGTSGYYNPFTSEAQINYAMPVFNRPFVACHEMSHQVGYGAEDEADFAGFIIAIKSKDRLLRYSGYHLAVDEFMHTLRRRDTVAHKELKAMISKQVHQDFVAERAYWMAYETQLSWISSIFYDNFLKANNQPRGLATYNRMVLLVMAWEKCSLVH